MRGVNAHWAVFTVIPSQHIHTLTHTHRSVTHSDRGTIKCPFGLMFGDVFWTGRKAKFLENTHTHKERKGIYMEL